jgi:two-component system response regulator YesN
VLKEYQSLVHLKALMINVTELAISLINSNREKKNIDIINQAKELIESNVEKDISLREMANRLYISPCYLSSLFKMKTNTSYKDYTILKAS